jgi:hypothetical protein
MARGVLTGAGKIWKSLLNAFEKRLLVRRGMSADEIKSVAEGNLVLVDCQRHHPKWR